MRKRMRMHEILMVYWDLGSQFSKLEKVHTHRQTWLIIPRFTNVIPAIWLASSFICPQGCWYAANEYVKTSPSKLQIALSVLLQWRGSLARSLFPSERKESGSYTRRTCLETRKPVMNELKKKTLKPPHLSTGIDGILWMLLVTSKVARALPGPCTLGGLKVEPSCDIEEHPATSPNEAKAKAPVFSDMALCKAPLINEDSSNSCCVGFLFRTQAKLACTSVDCPEFRYSDTIGWIVSNLPKRRGRQ